ncbi:hypothetical protein [Mycoplasma sp. ATU-Cv-508]|uniref:hypothetical protein n=1 Tax=Mycoplasma sp. ATU-Cv-508 TaxID=2048001 RepID=UPI000FDD2727
MWRHHVSSTAKIERFKIIRLESKGSGVYRIEAITSHQSIENYQREERAKMHSQAEQLLAKIKTLEPTYQPNFSLEKDITITSELIQKTN